MTKYEEKILNIVNHSSTHMTSEEIFFALKKEEPKVVLASVYNNLSRLVSKGLITKLTIPNQPDRYDHTDRHDHLVCSRCGKISDFKFIDLTSQLEDSLGEMIEGYSLQIYHICPECKANQEMTSN